METVYIPTLKTEDKVALTDQSELLNQMFLLDFISENLHIPSKPLALFFNPFEEPGLEELPVRVIKESAK